MVQYLLANAGEVREVTSGVRRGVQTAEPSWYLQLALEIQTW